MVTMPVEPGQQSVKLRGTAVKAAAVEKEQPVVVDGIAAVLFQVSQGNNPIEVGGQTSYEIRVVNQGSKAAANVRLAVLLPPELKALAAEGPSRYAMDNGRVLFDALPLLAPKADAVYRVRGRVCSRATSASAASFRPTRCKRRSRRKKAPGSIPTSRIAAKVP